MNINGTLFAQIINFLCAYFIMHRLLFRPVLEAITEDKNEILLLEQARELEKQKQHNFAKEKEAIWQKFRKLFALHVPKLVTSLLTDEVNIPDITIQNKFMNQQETQWLTQLIVEKVKYVHK